MKKFNKTARAAQWLLCLTLVIATPLAHGTILNNGDSGPPSFLFPGGTLMTSLSGTITTPTFSTSYTTWVYSDPSNTFCAGCLDFVYRFTNHGPDVNERFTMFNFLSGIKVDAGYDPSTPGNPPLTVNRSLSGEVVGFNYNASNNLLPGKTTPLLVIEVNATKFTSGYVTAQDGTAGFAAAFAPLQAIPEPSSLGLFGGGLLLVVGFLRKFWTANPLY